MSRRYPAVVTEESLIDLARFLDIFCVDYPEVWAKLEKTVMKRRTTFDLDTVSSLLRHFSNQGEGSDFFFDQFEQILTPQLESMTAQQLIVGPVHSRASCSVTTTCAGAPKTSLRRSSR